MNAAPLAWAVGLLPLLVVHLCYLISAQAEWVPWCFPYIEGCSSISRAARHGLANHLFKAVMLPNAALTALFWWLSLQWLRTLGRAQMWTLHAMFTLGTIGALFLVLYAAFLGVEGSTYQWLRRYGVTVYFSFTVLAQMLLAHALWPEPRVSHRTRVSLVLLCAAMLLLGVASLPLQYLAQNRDAAVNAIEWSYALLMTTVFPLAGLAWRETGLRLRIALESRN